MRTNLLRKIGVLIFLITVAGCTTAPRYTSSEVATAPAPQDRPGLATTYGETRGSSVQTRDFERQNASRPWLQAAIFYNDAAGSDEPAAFHRQKWIPLNRMVTFSIRNAQGTPFSILQKLHFFGSSEYTVIGKSGERYEMVVENQSDTRLEIVASVDGLDVLDGKPAAVTKRGYLVGPGKTLVIEGWRTSLTAVAAFRFGAVKDSYAEKKYGDARNVGVIGLAVFHPIGHKPRPYLEQETRRRKKADPFPSSGSFAEPPRN